MLSTLLVVGVVSHLWCAAHLVGIAHHSFYSVNMVAMYRVCRQGGNIKCVNRVAMYRACEQGGNI